MNRISIYVYAIFMMVMCLTGSAVNAAQEQAQQKAQRQKMEKVSKEIQELNQTLKHLQEKLAKTTKTLETLPAFAKNSEEKAPAKSWALYYFEQLNEYLKHRFQAFVQGLEELSALLLSPPPLTGSLSLHLLSIVLSILVGIGGIYLGKIFLQPKIERRIAHMGTQNPYGWFLVVLLLVLPSPFYFLLSILTRIGLEAVGVCGAVPNAWHTIHTAFLPLNLYFLWAGFVGTRLIFSPYRVSQALLPIDPYGAYYGALWIRATFIVYFLGEMGLIVLGIFPLSDLLIRTFVDILGLGIGFFLFRAFTLLKDHLIPKTSLRTMGWVWLLRWIICGLFILWFLNRSLFNLMLWPVAATILGLSALPILQRGLRTCYIRILWKLRRHAFILRVFWHPKKVLETVVRWTLYIGLGLVWIGCLWAFEDVGLFPFLANMTTVILYSAFMGDVFKAFIIFVGATLLVKIGINTLRYYVEDRYANSSSENNFLASRLKTLMAMLKTLLQVLVWVPAVSMIFLQFNQGASLVTLFTYLGAASFGLTFGVQSIVRDFITGFFIILENNLMVGDEVEVDGRVGVIEDITIRTFKIRQDTGMLLTIPFGSLNIIGNKNRKFSAVLMNISVGYTEDMDKVQALVEKAFFVIKKIPGIGRNILGSLDIRGINEVTSYSTILQVKIRTTPNSQDMVRRAYNKALKHLFDEAGIVVPSSPHSVSKAAPSLTNTTLS